MARPPYFAPIDGIYRQGPKDAVYMKLWDEGLMENLRHNIPGGEMKPKKVEIHLHDSRGVRVISVRDGDVVLFDDRSGIDLDQIDQIKIPGIRVCWVEVASLNGIRWIPRKEGDTDE